MDSQRILRDDLWTIIDRYPCYIVRVLERMMDMSMLKVPQSSRVIQYPVGFRVNQSTPPSSPPTLSPSYLPTLSIYHIYIYSQDGKQQSYGVQMACADNA